MNTFVDTLMLVLFVLFMIYIFRGYHISRREADEKRERDAAGTPGESKD